ncbi:hypothetical protein GCM10023321_44950 [Pseudonocardia eucalypti]|uniref:Uncharacterized protein n=1 Tax=Pseudonocardia eucalypti TaxID=648755 RepID=A0ABP9QFN8_9PSEU|nr:hypothetical protein [Pseudonocardia eucalypti]
MGEEAGLPNRVIDGRYLCWRLTLATRPVTSGRYRARPGQYTGTPPATTFLRAATRPASRGVATIHPQVRDALAKMITCWIGHPNHYTDPALALATVLRPHQPPGPALDRRRGS